MLRKDYHAVVSATRAWFRKHPTRGNAFNLFARVTAPGRPRTAVAEISRRAPEGWLSDGPEGSWGVTWAQRGQGEPSPIPPGAYWWGCAAADEAAMLGKRRRGPARRRLAVAEMRANRRKAAAEGFRPAWG